MQRVWCFMVVPRFISGSLKLRRSYTSTDCPAQPTTSLRHGGGRQGAPCAALHRRITPLSRHCQREALVRQGHGGGQGRLGPWIPHLHRLIPAA